LKRRASIAGISLILSLGLAAAIPLARAGLNLLKARASLTADAASLDRRDVVEAKTRLDSASDSFASLPLRVLAALPGIGDNYDSMRAVTEASADVMEKALVLQDWREDNVSGIFAGGRVDLDLLAGVREPLAAQTEALEELELAAQESRSGWLLPPVWDALEELGTRAGELRSGSEKAQRLLDHAGALFGDPEPRTYLVMSMNNAELRGAGGLLSGIGTLTMDHGRIDVGRQWPREYFQRKPYRSVPASRAYLERYGNFKANTTLWANVTFSPDVVEDARIASQLFELQTGTKTDGALVVDPRGLEALVPADAAIEVPGSDRVIEADELATWIYSDAYAEFADDDARRLAILKVGRLALSAALEGEPQSGMLESLGEAVAGKHVSFVSFEKDELSALEDLGLAPTLGETPGDHALVAVHNFGDGGNEGTKLDYWTDRTVRHACSIGEGSLDPCVLELTLLNSAPTGLTRYVAGAPYAMLRSYVELFIPAKATVVGVYLDGEPAEFATFDEGDVQSVSVYTQVPRSEQRTITIHYGLPPRNDYSLLFSPQPLARDARIDLGLRVPADWTVESPLTRSGDVYRYAGTLEGDVRVTARPDARTGIPALWDAFVDLLRSSL